MNKKFWLVIAADVLTLTGFPAAMAVENWWLKAMLAAATATAIVFFNFGPILKWRPATKSRLAIFAGSAVTFGVLTGHWTGSVAIAAVIIVAHVVIAGRKRDEEAWGT